MQKVPPVKRSDVTKAVQMAALKWVEDHGGPTLNQSEAARVAKQRGFKISQPNLSWAMKGQKIGPEMTAQVAELFETTGDGLVAMFLGAKVVALRDLPGWKTAKAEAMSKAGGTVQPWVWHDIDNVTVPGRVKAVDTGFIQQLALLLQMYGVGSGVMARVR